LLKPRRSGRNNDRLFFGDHGRECFRGKSFLLEQRRPRFIGGALAGQTARWDQPANDLVQHRSDVQPYERLAVARGRTVSSGFHGIHSSVPECQEARLTCFTAREPQRRHPPTACPDGPRDARIFKYKFATSPSPNALTIPSPMVYADTTNPNLQQPMMRRKRSSLPGASLTRNQSKFLAPASSG